MNTKLNKNKDFDTDFSGIILGINTAIAFAYIFLSVYLEFKVAIFSCVSLFTLQGLILIGLKKKLISGNFLTHLVSSIQFLFIYPICYYSGGVSSTVNIWLMATFTSIFLIATTRQKVLWASVIICSQVFNLILFSNGYDFPFVIKEKDINLFNSLVIAGSVVYLALVYVLYDLWRQKVINLNKLIESENNFLDSVRQQYLDVQSMVKAGAWELDVKTEKTDWSEQIYEIYKIPKGTPTNKIDGLSFYAPHEREKLLGLIGNCIKKGEDFDDTFEFYDNENTKKYVRAIGRPIKNSNGEVVKIAGTFQDITEQITILKKTQDLSREAELISTGLNSYAIVAKTDVNGKITYVNDLFCDISKYSREELIGSDHRILNSGHHPKSFFKHIWGEIKSKKSWRGEIKNKAKDGSFYWVDTTIIPVLSANGEIEGYSAFRFDITQRKNAELALIESENKFKQIFSQSHDAVMTLHPPTWLFTSCNQATLDLFKVKSEEEFKKLGPWNLSPEFQASGEPSSSLAPEAIKKAMEDGSHYIEWTHQTIDGQLIPCTVLLSRISEGNSSYLQATVRDISKEKDLLKKLTESNEYLDLALEGTNLGIWDWYLTDNSVKYNERWARLRGVKVSDLNMDLKDWESRVHPDDLPISYEKINDYINGKTSYFEHIHRVKHSNGSWVYILGRGRFSEFDSNGKPLRFTGTDMDVTELMNNKSKLDLFFKKAPYGFAFCDMEGKFIEINQEMSRITGYTKEELNNLSYWDLTPEKYAEDEKNQLKSLSEIGSFGPYTKEYKRKNGELIPVKLNGFIVEDYDGKKGIWTIIEDVTQKVKLENEKNELMNKVQETSQKLEAIFDFSPVMVYECLINENWTMNFVNAYTETITGYKPEELVNDRVVSFASIIHKDDKEYVEKEVVNATSKNSTYKIQYRIIHKNGETRWLWEKGSKNPKTNALIGVISDITERKLAEDMTLLLSHVRSRFIKHSNNKKEFFKYLLDKILSSSNSDYGFVGEILEDKKGKYLKTFALTDISWNDETRKFYQEKAPTGLEFRNLNTLFGEVIKTGKLLISNNATEHPKFGGLPTGHPPLNSFMGIPICYNGEIIAMVGVANNKLGYKEENYNYLKPFFDLIGEMIQSIRLSDELELQKKISLHNTKLASIGELAAGVGHEINNPLAIIKGNLEVLQSLNTKGSINQEDLSVKLEKSIKGVDRISNIVKGLRAFARADEAVHESLNITELICETKDMLGDIFKNEGISFNLQLENNLWISGNRGRLQQVFVNLLTNAKDALEKSDFKQIDVRAIKKGKDIEIQICDNGPGVPSHLQEKIFDPFFTTKEVNKGTGIGLALVSTIIKEHGGIISLDNGYKNGACFLISVKALEQSEVKLKESVEEKVQEKSKGTILLVDDEEDLREILQDILESYGFKVFTSANGQEAFKYLENNYSTIDLIISDMQMPIMNGPDLARNVKNFKKYQGKFVFITGGVNVSLSEYKDFVDGILPKPFEQKKTINLINGWLNHEK